MLGNKQLFIKMRYYTIKLMCYKINDILNLRLDILHFFSCQELCQDNQMSIIIIFFIDLSL